MENQVDLPEVRIEEALENQDGDEAWNGIGQEEHEAIDAAEAKGLPVQEHRQHHAQTHGEQHRQEGEGDGPDEDLQEGFSNGCVGEDAEVVLPADVHLEARIHWVPCGCLIEACFHVWAQQAAVLMVDEAAIGVASVLLFGGRELAQARHADLVPVGHLYGDALEEALLLDEVLHGHLVAHEGNAQGFGLERGGLLGAQGDGLAHEDFAAVGILQAQAPTAAIRVQFRGVGGSLAPVGFLQEVLSGPLEVEQVLGTVVRETDADGVEHRKHDED